jgi:hypothetical protein
MRAYYGSRFSPNLTATPEGFLICHNVPIARTGWYEYLGEEIGVNELTGKIVNVYRSPEAVFNPGAMASFEGKILSDEHPLELVTPENATRYTKGVVQNVRQGTGADNDLLIADLMVYDQSLINEIQSGKREVSCGYDCVYEAMDDGNYHQKQICGNHVAVVKNGRAGIRVAIKDSKIELKPEGEKKMAKIKLPGKKFRVTDVLAAIGLKVFATDAEPEEIMDAVNSLAEEKKTDDADKEDPKPDPVKDGDPDLVEDAESGNAALEAKVDKLTEMVTQFMKNGTKDEEADPEKSIDAAIAELEKASDSKDDEEESHTIPAENMDEEGPISVPSDRPISALTGDNAYKIAALRAIKPVIAAISDLAQRKIATDAALASIKSTAPKNTYAQISNAQKKAATDKKAVNDKQSDPAQLGRDIAAKYNPHYIKRA